MYMIAEQLITRRHPSPVTRLPVTSDPSPGQPQPLMVARNVLGVYLLLHFNSSSFRFVILHFNTSSFQFFGLRDSVYWIRCTDGTCTMVARTATVLRV